MRRLVVGVVLVLALACGESPSSPSGTDLSGTWTGQTSTVFGLGLHTATITEAGATLTGTWVAEFPAHPEVNNSGQIQGTRQGANVSLTLLPSNPATCPYVFSGTVQSATQMTGTFATANCPVATGGSITLTKQ